MALKFNCPQCNAKLFSRRLHQGELAECTECGARFAARDAVTGDDRPEEAGAGYAGGVAAEKPAQSAPPEMPDYKPGDKDLRMECPRCRTHCNPGTEVCPTCNLSFSNVSLYSPRHFVWLSMLASFLVPVFLSASNYGRLGQGRKKKLLLSMGIAGFVAFLVAMVKIDEAVTAANPESEAGIRGIHRLISWVIHMPIGAYLKSRQKPLFEMGMGLGMRKASLFVGVLKGLGLTALVTILLVVGAVILEWEDPADRAAELVERGQYTAAVAIFDSLCTEYPDDLEYLYQKAMCLTFCHRYTEAERDFRAILGEERGFARVHLMLGILLLRKGLGEEAVWHLAAADSLEPGILEMWNSQFEEASDLMPGLLDGAAKKRPGKLNPGETKTN